MSFIDSIQKERKAFSSFESLSSQAFLITSPLQLLWSRASVITPLNPIINSQPSFFLNFLQRLKQVTPTSFRHSIFLLGNQSILWLFLPYSQCPLLGVWCFHELLMLRVPYSRVLGLYFTIYIHLLHVICFFCCCLNNNSKFLTQALNSSLNSRLTYPIVQSTSPLE